MKQKLAHILFWLGDKWSKLGDRFEWLWEIGVYYPVYNWLMNKSGDFDVNKEVWTESETL